MAEEKEKIYIVVSQTGTLLSKIIRFFTGAEYCHSSLSLDKDLTTLYTFGRKRAYNPFYGGYVKESPNFGTFKRFRKTKVVVLEFPVEKEVYDNMKRLLEEMYKRRKRFGYNYLGLIGALFKKKHRSPNRFYCSEFVNRICTKYGIYEESKMPEIVKPIDFFNAFKNKTVYTGLLSTFATT